jgi:AhpD family alkylhydroperoxidase
MALRFAPPPGGLTPFDHQPELWASFNRFYGTLWSEGVLDEATKEVGRLRNAGVTGCGICKNLRFAGAQEQGLSEEHVRLVADGDAEARLPERWRLAARWADALIALPAPIDPALRAALAAELRADEIVELTVTVATAIAFSKAAVAFGAPAEMPVTTVPTPTVDGEAAAPVQRSGDG